MATDIGGANFLLIYQPPLSTSSKTCGFYLHCSKHFRVSLCPLDVRSPSSRRLDSKPGPHIRYLLGQHSTFMAKLCISYLFLCYELSQTEWFTRTNYYLMLSVVHEFGRGLVGQSWFMLLMKLLEWSHVEASLVLDGPFPPWLIHMALGRRLSSSPQGHCQMFA